MITFCFTVNYTKGHFSEHFRIEICMSNLWKGNGFIRYEGYFKMLIININLSAFIIIYFIICKKV